MRHYLILIIVLASLTMTSYAGLKLATYNLGLAHTYVPLAKERRPHLTKALVDSKIDVLCLQEVWNGEDRQHLLKSLQGSHPHQYVTPIKNVKSKQWPTCRPWNLFGKGKFISCMRKNCNKLKGDDITNCILTTCGPALEKLKQDNRECATSLMAQVGKSPIHALLTVLNPFARAGVFSYKGSNGLMLLSKYPLSGQRLFDMTSISTLTKRAALVAEVNAKDAKYQVLCTHLTANLSSKVPYTGVFSGWDKENRVQFTTLIKEASRKALPTIMMGDFNCGLAQPQHSIDPHVEASCHLITDTGFHDHLADNNPQCTFCSESKNTLNEGKTKNYFIDHIYVLGATVALSQVIFKEKVIIQKAGKDHSSNLSDHFGILVELE